MVTAVGLGPRYVDHHSTPTGALPFVNCHPIPRASSLQNAQRWPADLRNLQASNGAPAHVSRSRRQTPSSSPRTCETKPPGPSEATSSLTRSKVCAVLPPLLAAFMVWVYAAQTSLLVTSYR
jgi:hypothetical protein